MTQAHHHAPARALMTRRKESGKSGKEALRILKRHLSNVVYHALTADTRPEIVAHPAAA